VHFRSGVPEPLDLSGLRDARRLAGAFELDEYDTSGAREKTVGRVAAPDPPQLAHKPPAALRPGDGREFDAGFERPVTP
jgi:long-subunit fatty acid transport protein